MLFEPKSVLVFNAMGRTARYLYYKIESAQLLLTRVVSTAFSPVRESCLTL